MSEVPRVPPHIEPGKGSKGERSVDDDKFKKLMRVEEVDKSETSEQRKRKRREEEAEEEAVEKAGGRAAPVKKVKAIEEGAPLARKKVAPKAVPAAPPTPPTATQAPMAGFKADEIEAYAWEEEAEAEAAAPARPYTREPAPTARAEAPAPEITGEAPKKSLAAAQPPPPEEPFATEEVVLGAAREEEGPPTPSEKAEEWPQTTSFRPSTAFRSHDEAPVIEREREIERRPAIERPSGPEGKEKEGERRKATVEERKEEKKKRKAPLEEEEAVKKKAPPAGMPKEIGKKGKEAEKTFAEMMEGEEEEKALPAAAKAEVPKEAAKPGMAAEKEVIKEGVKAPPVVPPEAPSKAEVKPQVPPIVPPAQLPEEAPAKEAAAAAKKGILAPEETFPSLKKTAPTTISPEKAEKEQKERVEGLVVPMAAPSEGGAGMGGEGEAKREGREAREEEIAALAARVPGEVAPFAPHIEAPAPTAPSPYAQMSPQVLALFERMVGVMTIIQTTGVTETVMTLNARQFASSVLYGSQIVIREFSTAPTSFNVEFIGSPEALALVQQNIPGLMGAVQQGNFNFTINRFDVKLATGEKPIFTRKEAVGERGEKEEKQEKDNRENP